MDELLMQGRGHLPYWKPRYISDSDLSKQAAALKAAGYLTITNSGRGRGAITAYKATKAGRHAYDQHRGALRGLLGD